MHDNAASRSLSIALITAIWNVVNDISGYVSTNESASWAWVYIWKPSVQLRFANYVTIIMQFDTTVSFSWISRPLFSAQIVYDNTLRKLIVSTL